MTATRYCDPRDLYEHGVPRGSVPNPGRVAAGADASTDAITLDVHGFDDDDPLQLRAEAGGSLPAPLVELTTYYADVLDDNRFGVRATAGGARIGLTTAGSRIVVIAPLPIGAAIDWASSTIEEWTPAHAVGSLASSRTVRVTCAALAAGKLMSRSGPMTKSLSAIVAEAQKQIERWARGIPVRDAPTTGRTNLAAAATARQRDPRGWRRFGGIE